MSSSSEPSDRERIDHQLAQESDNLTEGDLQAVRKAMRDEHARDQLSTGRRDYLKAGGLAAAGLIAGAGGADAASQELAGRAAATSGSTSVHGDLTDVHNLDAQSINAGSVNNDVFASKQGGIRNALSVATPGDRVIFDSSETVTQEVKPKDDVDIKARNGATLTGGAGITIVDLTGVSNVTIEGLVIDGNKSNYTTRPIDGTGSMKDVTLRDVTVTNSGIDGIRLLERQGTTSEAVSIESCTVKDSGASGGHGILVGVDTDSAGTMKDVHVNGNTVLDYHAVGIGLSGNTGTFKGGEVTGNTIASSSIAANSGISHEDVKKTTTTGNTVEGNISTGLVISGASEDTTLVGNTITGVGVNAIHLTDSAADNTVQANTIRGPGNNGVRDESAGANTVNGNTVNDSSNTAIRVSAPQDTIADNTISSSSSYGITIQTGGSGTSVSGNTAAGSHYSGILVAASNCSVTGNTSKNNNQAGVARDYEAAGIGINATDCTVTGNSCFDDQSTKTQTYGIGDAGDFNADYNTYTANALRENGTSAFAGNAGTNSVKSANIT